MEKAAALEDLARLRAHIQELKSKPAASGFDSPDFNTWRSSVRATLVDVFGSKHDYVRAFDRLNFALRKEVPHRPIKTNYF